MTLNNIKKAKAIFVNKLNKSQLKTIQLTIKFIIKLLNMNSIVTIIREKQIVNSWMILMMNILILIKTKTHNNKFNRSKVIYKIIHNKKLNSKTII